MEPNFHRILIVRTDRIGDVILTLPMADALKKRFSNIHIAMLIRHYTSELVEGNRNVDQIIYYDENNGTKSFFQLAAMLRQQQFDVVFHTHPRFHLALITWFAGIPVRVGTGYRWYSFFFNRRVYEHRKYAAYHELEYNLHLLNTIGCSTEGLDVKPVLEVNPDAMGKVKKLLMDIGIREDRRLVILHPGSGSSARDWSCQNFGALGKRISGIPNVQVIITGNALEKNLVDKVQSIAGSLVISIVNKLSLSEYAALAKLASLFIANSTGPIHIAAAVGTPVIGLYPQVTALNAARWGPYTNNKTIFSPKDKPTDCKICLHKNNSSCECMDSISVDEVYDAALKHLMK